MWHNTVKNAIGLWHTTVQEIRCDKHCKHVIYGILQNKTLVCGILYYIHCMSVLHVTLQSCSLHHITLHKYIIRVILQFTYAMCTVYISSVMFDYKYKKI